MDSHFLAFLENRKRVGTASLENLHRRNFVEEGRTLLTIAKVSRGNEQTDHHQHFYVVS